jgi:serine/threonine protein kinase
VLVQALDSQGSSKVTRVPWEFIEHITSNFEDVIASGGFGTIYRGTDMNANAEVAIKALRSDRMSVNDKKEFKKEVSVRIQYSGFQCCSMSLRSLLPSFLVPIGITPSKYRPPLGQVYETYKSLYGS